MKKRIILLIISISLILTLFIGTGSASASALQSGDFTYTDNGTSITIKGYTGLGGDITIPSTISGKPVTTIGMLAFAECNLTSVIIPDSVTSIGFAAFSQCTNLANINIPDSVLDIGNSAFVSTSLSIVNIPASVISIENCAFNDCKSLLEINVDANNANYSSIDGTLFNKQKTIIIRYPGGKTGSYEIPDTVKDIEQFAFSGCEYLTDIVIPNGVENIGYCAFTYNILLESMSLPESIKTIGEIAFVSCKKLKNITIPQGVTNIGIGAFRFCKSLTDINVSTNNAYFKSINGVLFNKSGTILKQYPEGKEANAYTVSADVKTIAEDAFVGCDNLKSVTISSGVEEIQDTAFLYCSNLTDIFIPDSVTEFGYGVFLDCNLLTIIGNTGSVAQEYAKDNDIPFMQTSVSGLKAASASYSSVKLTWNANTGAEGFQIFRSTSQNGTYNWAGTVKTNTFTSNYLATGTKYYYKVRAYKGNYYTDFSAPVSATPVISVPTYPKAVSASYNSIKISWNAVSGANGYQVFRSTSQNGTYSWAGTVTTNSFTNNYLTTGKTNYYKVRAYRGNYYTAFSSKVSAKPVPATPANFTASRASRSSIKLKWNSVAGASGYQIYRATSQSGTYSLIKTTTATNYTNTGLTKNKYYYYKVRAYRTVNGVKIYGSFTVIKSAKPY